VLEIASTSRVSCGDASGGKRIYCRSSGRLSAVFVALAMATYSAAVASEPGQVKEYQLKAAFLYNFGKFIDWPPDAFSESGDRFNLCVFGNEAFELTRETLGGKSIRGHTVEIRKVESLSRELHCHLLFVSGRDQPLPDPSVLAELRATGTLTVGESGRFLVQGGVINLTRVDNRVRFEIDRGSGEKAGFRFSAQLLKLATHRGHAR
jgi:hypothetical protein